MAQNRHRGGRQRGESKEQIFSVCPVCHQEVSKRQSRQVERDGELVRVCKRHPAPKTPTTRGLTIKEGSCTTS